MVSKSSTLTFLGGLPSVRLADGPEGGGLTGRMGTQIAHIPAHDLHPVQAAMKSPFLLRHKALGADAHGNGPAP